MTDRPDNAYVHEIRIGWGDCDPDRIAYTGRLSWFALEAIDAWWEAKLGGDGWYQLNIDRNIGTPFVHLSLDFKTPVTPRHRLRCHVWPTRLGKTSIEFRVDAEQDGALCFSGHFVCVFIVSDAFAKRTPPEDIRSVVETYLPS